MNRVLPIGALLVGLAMVVVLGSTGRAAEPAAPPAKAAAPATAPAGAKQPAAVPRKLAPWVMHSVDPAVQLEETFSHHDIVELLAAEPDLNLAKNVTFRRDIWQLDFQFKTVRMIWVDIPQPSGKMQRKQVWYLVYSVTNPGKALHPVVAENGSFQIEHVDIPVRFAPIFTLEIPKLQKSYADEIIPVAMAPIQSREDRHQQLLTTVDVCREIAVGETLWGVATWQDIDPRVDRFSIFVQGLTNAYKWQDEEGKFKKGDPPGSGRILARKTLQLNFLRPGDEFSVDERQIQLGAPGEVDYQWVYR